MKAATLSIKRSNQQGITLIEMVVIIVMLGFVASIALAAMGALSGVGKEAQTTEYAKLAQQRMELILNEKQKGKGFTGLGDCPGPDPCCLYDEDLDLDACSDKINPPEFESDSNDDECSGEGLDYCTVTVTTAEDDKEQKQVFNMRLYNY